MSVFKLKDRPHGKARKLPWRGVVNRQGQPPLVKHFADKAESILWEAEHKKRERLREVPEYQRMVELKELGQYTVRDVVEFYIANHPSPISKNNLITLNAFLREDICSKNLLQLTKQDVNWFVEKKKTETWKSPGSNSEAKLLSPRTIRRLLNILQRVFQWSLEFRSGFETLPNHFRAIRIQGSTGGRRERSLENDELERILEACNSCHSPNNYFVPLAIYLAIDTGMRRQEIFNLVWTDIDDTNRRIKIRKSKTDKATGTTEGTTIVLPAKANALLITLAALRWGKPKDGEKYIFPQTEERIFPMSEKAFSQSWGDVLKRAGIENLHFHDLRREANTRFIRAGLTLEERNLMLRHADKSMNATYIGRNFLLNGIMEKLDKYNPGGMVLWDFNLLPTK